MDGVTHHSTGLCPPLGMHPKSQSKEHEGERAGYEEHSASKPVGITRPALKVLEPKRWFLRHSIKVEGPSQFESQSEISRV